MHMIQIVVPLINPNELKARVVAIFIENGQCVNKNDLLCTLETTKSTQDLLADNTGFISGLKTKVGDVLSVGDTLCFISDDPHWQPSVKAHVNENKEPQEEQNNGIPADLPEGLRMTLPAIRLAKQHNLRLENLPREKIITQKDIKFLIKNSEQNHSMTNKIDPTAIIIYGGGGHGKSLIELINELQTYKLMGIIDDQLLSGSEIINIPILGNKEDLDWIYQKGIHLAVNAVGGIGDIDARLKVFERLKKIGFTFPTLIHPTAFVEKSAQLAPGVQIMPHAYVGSDVTVGFGVIVNSGAIISHDCTIDEYAILSPGATLAGGVKIGTSTLVGMGATINLQVTIGARSQIGNNATIKSDVPKNSIVRAATVYPS